MDPQSHTIVCSSFPATATATATAAPNMAPSGAGSRRMHEPSSEIWDTLDVFVSCVNWSRYAWQRSLKPGYLLMTLPSHAMDRQSELLPLSVTVTSRGPLKEGDGGPWEISASFRRHHMLWIAVARYPAARLEMVRHTRRRNRRSSGDGGLDIVCSFWRSAADAVRKGDVSASIKATMLVSNEYASRIE